MTHLTHDQSTFVLLINICFDALIIVQYNIVFKREIKCTKILNDQRIDTIHSYQPIRSWVFNRFHNVTFNNIRISLFNACNIFVAVPSQDLDLIDVCCGILCILWFDVSDNIFIVVGFVDIAGIVCWPSLFKLSFHKCLQPFDTSWKNQWKLSYWH